MRHLLLLCNRPARNSNAHTILEHINAIKAMPGFYVREVSMLGDIPATIDLERFEAIGIHYSLHINDPNNHFLSLKAMDRIAAFSGVKCIWMHDEYRQVNSTIVKLGHMGINIIFTVIPEETAAKIYTSEKLPNAKIKTVLTGYVEEHMRHLETPLFSNRNIDVVYRARRPPFWLGGLGMEKIDIGLRFLHECKNTDLKTDISVEEWDRVYGNQWLNLLKQSKAGLAVESGASLIDFTGEIEAAVEAYVYEHRKATFMDVAPIMADYDYKYVINCISPRIFELAACRTLIIAFPGKYSNIISPWKHYLPLKKDFSNFEEIVYYLKNKPEQCEAIIKKAYNDLIRSGVYSYRNFAKFSATAIPQSNYIANKPYNDIRFFFDRYRSLTYLIHNFIAYIFQGAILSGRIRRYLIAIWSKVPMSVQRMLRPHMRFIGR